MKWYKLVRQGKITIMRVESAPIVWGKLDYRIFEYMPSLGCTDKRRNWVQVAGAL